MRGGTGRPANRRQGAGRPPGGRQAGALARHAAADAGQERASGRSISAQHRSAGPGASTAPAFSLGSDRRAVAHSSINALFLFLFHPKQGHVSSLLACRAAADLLVALFYVCTYLLIAFNLCMTLRLCLVLYM